jgi:FKBP-type peptidyl-prolyl cis-trans isomerase SlyD
MSAISAGSAVKIHYTLTVDGEIVDSSTGREPLAYVQGQGMLVPGVEAGLEGLSAGAKKHLSISAKDGYGESDPELTLTAPKEAFAKLELKVGSTVRASGPDGDFRAVVSAIGETVVTLDLNHPLAGKTLEFDVEVVSVEPPPSKIIRP